jgi:Amt family ammonium transporter
MDFLGFNILDTFWVLFCAFLVFFMNLGFASVEAGFARSKNTVNILSKNFIVFAVSSLGFLFLGWGLMFGSDAGFVGTQNLWILGKSTEALEGIYGGTLTDQIPFWAKFFFQLVFCGTAATIVSGAVAERIKYIAFIIFSLILTLVIYPIVGHWIWGGGWLAKLGFSDFAGDTVVHSVGGWAALAGVIVLGPRIGKYTKNKKTGKTKANAIPGHNMSLAVIGLFVLWLGWFGFNPGSTLTFSNTSDVAHVVMTTNTAAIAAVLTSTITAWIIIGKPDLGMTVNGCLAGLVAITGGAQAVSVLSSFIIGLIAGVIVVLFVILFDKLKIDDPVGATSVHLGCGIFGTICIGLFAEKGVSSLNSVESGFNGLFFGGGVHQLGIQLLGIVVVGAFTFGSTLLVWFILKKTMGIRVSRKEEVEGLDIGEHGNRAYPNFAEQPEVIDDGEVAEITGITEPSETVSVSDTSTKGAKLTKVTIIANQARFGKLQSALEEIGITGITVTSVQGYGQQKGNTEYYRGAPVESKLLPKVKVDVVVSKIPTELLVGTVQKALHTGNIGDGKIFIYDVEDVVKVRTGESGYAALQDE